MRLAHCMGNILVYPKPMYGQPPYCSSPSSNNTHAEGTHEYQDASIHPPLTTENSPAFITEEVFRHEFNEGCKNQQPCGNCIHDTDDEQTNFGIRAIKSVCCEADSLSNRCPRGWLECLSSAEEDVSTYVQP